MILSAEAAITEGPVGQVRTFGSVVGRYVGQFVLIGFVALVVLAIASLITSRRAGSDEAIRDAKARTGVLARQVVEPRLTRSLIDGDQADVEDLSAAMAQLNVTESFVHLRIWTEDGRIVYSDQDEQTGTTSELTSDAKNAFATSEVHAEVSDLSAAENALEREEGKLLEVYQPVTAMDGTPLLFETYHPFEQVNSFATRIWWSFLPAVLIPLGLLQLVQIPLAVRLARKVQEAQDERAQLLERVIDASDSERRSIAHDLHDGAVQDLAGVTYALSVVSNRAATAGDDRSVDLVDGASDAIRRSIQSLRSLFVEIYPPNLERAGLEVALSDLLAPLAGRGTETSFSYPPGLELSSETNKLLYRVAQEATRNVMRHAGASSLALEITENEHVVCMRISDNGQGLNVDHLNAITESRHIGLRIMTDLVSEAGGTLTLESKPGAGTELEVSISA